jgi:mannose-6-phosphate isomerase-like protein (cupin superfamily)
VLEVGGRVSRVEGAGWKTLCGSAPASSGSGYNPGETFNPQKRRGKRMSESDAKQSRRVYAEDVVELARRNGDFRRVLFTTERSQLVLMSIEPGDEIGEETHEGIDQVLMFVAGEGEAVLAGESRPVREGSIVVVPAGTRHNFITRGNSALKLYTVYTPPEHADGTVHHTKAEADEYEREHHH